MNIKLIENAIDSLKLTIDYYDKYTTCNSIYDDRYLKLTIIFLHNSIELLIKSIMIEYDEESIYILDEKSNEVFKRAKLLQRETNYSLDEILIKIENVKTLSFSKLIEKYTYLFETDLMVSIILKRLSRYRNAITHFGIDREDKLDELYNTIYEAFGIICYTLYPQLVNIHDYFSYNDVIDMLEPWIDVGIDFQKELFMQNEKWNIIKFFNLFKETIETEKFNLAIQAAGIKLDSNSGFDKGVINFEFTYLSDYYINLYSRYSPFHNVTVIFDDMDYTWLIVDHSLDKLYLYEKDNQYSWIPEKYKTWEKDVGTKCRVKPLTINNIRKHIIDKLKMNEFNWSKQ